MIRSQKLVFFFTVGVYFTHEVKKNLQIVTTTSVPLYKRFFTFWETKVERENTNAYIKWEEGWGGSVIERISWEEIWIRVDW